MHDLSLLSSSVLDDQQRAAIHRADFVDASEVLLCDPRELKEKCHFKTIEQAESLIRAVSRGVFPRPRAVVGDLVKRDEDRWVGTGDREIDRLLGGGFRKGAVTEIVGESAAGKSHFGLQLAITSQLSTYTQSPGGTILLTSERKLSSSRIEQLASHALHRTQTKPCSSASSAQLPESVREMLDNVHTRYVTEVPEAKRVELEKLTHLERIEREVSDVELLDLALSHHVPSMIDRLAGGPNRQDQHSKHGRNGKRLPITTLIIDSIGALFRASFENNHIGLAQRSTMLCQISDKLKFLAEKHDLAVIVINQVTDVFDRASSFGNGNGNSNAHVSSTPPTGGGPSFSHAGDDDIMSYKIQSRYFSGQTNDLAKEATLGLVWANSVNVRIMLSRTGRRRRIDRSREGHPGIGTRKRARTSSAAASSGSTVHQANEASYENENEIDLPDQDVQSSFDYDQGGDHPDRGTGSSSINETDLTLIRRLHLVFSPFAPESMIDYMILSSGIHSLPTSQTTPRRGHRGVFPIHTQTRTDDVEAEAEAEVQNQALEYDAGLDDDDLGEVGGLMEELDDHVWSTGVFAESSQDVIVDGRGGVREDKGGRVVEVVY